MGCGRPSADRTARKPARWSASKQVNGSTSAPVVARAFSACAGCQSIVQPVSMRSEKTSRLSRMDHPPRACEPVRGHVFDRPILDPDEGEVYKIRIALLDTETATLESRGFIGIAPLLGRSETWGSQGVSLPLAFAVLAELDEICDRLQPIALRSARKFPLECLAPGTIGAKERPNLDQLVVFQTRSISARTAGDNPAPPINTTGSRARAPAPSALRRARG